MEIGRVGRQRRQRGEEREWYFTDYPLLQVPVHDGGAGEDDAGDTEEGGGVPDLGRPGREGTGWTGV